MRNVFKQPLIFSLALLINIILFLLIQQLVTNDVISLPKGEDLHWVDYIRLEQIENPAEEIKKSELPDKPPEPEQTSPLPDLAQPDIPKPPQLKVEIPAPGINVPLAIDGIPYLGDYLKSSPAAPAAPDLSEIDTDVIPSTRIEPVYPPRALRAGIEGIVTAEFTITTDGTVTDIRIVRSDPPEIFDNAVIQAIKKWKFAPEIVNGRAVEKRARQDIRFTLKK
jgi:protein TonB